MNIMAEFFASLLFTLLYFIFISRHLSPDFNLNYVMLSYTIGLAFFASVFVPFYTYRINIIPFVSVVNAIRKKQWIILVYKIPAQISGALIGVVAFIFINEATTQTEIFDLYKFTAKDPLMIAAINGIIAGILCYGFYVIRILFKFKSVIGTVILGFLVTTLFFISHFFHGVSALNPFGLLFYDLLSSDSVSLVYSWYYWILIHIISPAFFSIAAFFYLKGRYNKPKGESAEKEKGAMPEYDI